MLRTCKLAIGLQMFVDEETGEDIYVRFKLNHTRKTNVHILFRYGCHPPLLWMVMMICMLILCWIWLMTPAALSLQLS